MPRSDLPAAPHPRTSDDVRALQRQAGNQAVSQLLSGREQLTVQRQVPPAPPALAHPVLRQGSHGEQVKEAQRKLSRVRASALPLNEDGSFGALTTAAVRAFQTTSGIAPATGVLDAATWTQLDAAFAALPAPVRSVLAFGATGADVGFAQQKLNAVGATPRLAINGVYDSAMLTPVIAFEVLQLHRLPTGVIDAAMWAALDAAVAGGFTALEGASGTPIEQDTPSGTANSLGTTAPGTSLHPTVGAGGLTRGAAVKELQQRLNGAGAAPALNPDGKFGSKTRTAVTAFQAGRVPPLPSTGVADQATWAALDAVAPRSTVGAVDRQWTETVGGHTYGMTGASASRYSWEITATRMLVTVKVNFTGLAPPAAWFGHVPAVWNQYQGVDPATNRKMPIDFEMVRGSGGDAVTIAVNPGTGRANAGNWFVGDANAASTVPHEYGHLIGLQDEYQLHPGDYVRATGHEPPVGQAAGPVGVTPQTIAANLQAAMIARNDVNAATAVTGVGPGAFAQQVVAAYRALPLMVVPAVPFSPGPPPVAAQPAVPLTGDLIADLDASLPNTGNRYNVIQVLTYTSGSIMGDPSRAPDPHDHGAQPRHVAEFTGILGQALGGNWRAERR
jgi:peptidoglycan hydrolase-like protein with peptidoglycan-binding domain